MAEHNQFRLLRERRFLPFFLTQALGAFNDNVFRNATVLLIGFEMGLSTEQITTYSNIAPALFILPFFLFSASAGQIAEKFEKTRVIRFVKLFEIAAMSVASFGFLAHNAALLLSVLFLMCIAFLPFPTAVLAEYLPQPAGRRVAVAGYSATFVIIALAYNALWWYAVRDGRLLAPTADMSSVRTISRRYLIGPTAYFLSFLLAFVNPWASLAVHGALIVFYLLPV